MDLKAGIKRVNFKFQPPGRPKQNALTAAPNFSPKPSPRGSPKGSPHGSVTQGSKQNLHDTSMASSMVSVTPRSLNGSTWLTQTPNSLEYSVMTGGAYSRPRPVLTSYEVSKNGCPKGPYSPSILTNIQIVKPIKVCYLQI